MSDKLDRDKLLRGIEADLAQLPPELLRRFASVLQTVAKGSAVDVEGELDQETDQERGERLGTRYRSDAPFGKGSFGGLKHHKKPFEPGAGDDD